MKMNLQFVIIPLISIFCLPFHGSISVQKRIVDGSKIDIMEIPFMLSLRLKGDHICGAAVISRDWGLTAAHCVTTYVRNDTDYSVRSGSSFWEKGGKIHNITTIIWNEMYNDLNGDYDIAVFRVDPPFKFDETTNAIDLPGSTDYVYDKWALIAGWGYYRTRENVLSKELRYAKIPMLDRVECIRNYEGRYDVTAEQVCYGYSEGGTDACKGDSGGPLFTNDSIILGVTSWGEDCGSQKSPGVYTTIFLMLDWISEKTGVESRL